MKRRSWLSVVVPLAVVAAVLLPGWLWLSRPAFAVLLALVVLAAVLFETFARSRQRKREQV